MREILARGAARGPAGAPAARGELEPRIPRAGLKPELKNSQDGDAKPRGPEIRRPRNVILGTVILHGKSDGRGWNLSGAPEMARAG